MGNQHLSCWIREMAVPLVTEMGFAPLPISCVHVQPLASLHYSCSCGWMYYTGTMLSRDRALSHLFAEVPCPVLEQRDQRSSSVPNSAVLMNHYTFLTPVSHRDIPY